MAIVFLVGVVMMTSVASQGEGLPAKNVHSHEDAQFVMGTLARIQVSAPTRALAVQCVAVGFRALDVADSVFSTWRPDSELSNINRHAGTGPVQISDAMAAVLSSALDISTRSGGAFDPTVLPLVKLWGFRDPQPGPPPLAQDVAQVLMAVGAHLVKLQTDSQTVELLHPETKLDLGALAKGAALDEAAAAMMQCGAQGGMLDLGGGLLVFGETDVQLVGVVNPLDPNNPLDVIPLAKGAVATSGQYERFRESEGQAWGHILDPRTGWPCQQTLSVTVVTETALLADALATACFVLGPADGYQLLENTPGCEGLLMFESLDGGSVLLSTSNWP